jgi:hypothetical protein
MQETAASLEQITYRSSFIELEPIPHNEAQNVELLVSEIQDRMRLLENIATRNAMISAPLLIRLSLKLNRHL